MNCHFTHQTRAGDVYHTRVENVASWVDEPYPPGGFLRIMRDAQGRILSGPHVDELISWSVQYVTPATGQA
jgi:hypothetical protein